MMWWWMAAALAAPIAGAVRGTPKPDLMMLPDAASGPVVLAALDDGSMRVSTAGWQGRLLKGRVGLDDPALAATPEPVLVQATRTQAGWELSLDGLDYGGTKVFGVCASSGDAPWAKPFGSGHVVVSLCDGRAVVRWVGADGAIVAAPDPLLPGDSPILGVAVERDADGSVLVAAWGADKARVTTWTGDVPPWVWTPQWMPVGPPVDVAMARTASDATRALVTLDLSLGGVTDIAGFKRAGDALALVGRMRTDKGPKNALLVFKRYPARPGVPVP